MSLLAIAVNRFSVARLSFLVLKFSIVLCIFITGLTIGARRAHAATLYWVGSAGANASTASNWKTTNPTTCGSGDSLSAPSSADIVNFDADCDNSATIDGGFSSSVTSMVLSSGYAGTVTQSNPLTITGAFTVTGGTYSAGSQTLTVGATTTVNGGTLNLGSSTTGLAGLTFSSGTLTLSSGTTGVTGALTFSGAGTFNNSGGTLNITGTTTATLSCNNVSFNRVTLTHTAGTKSVSTNCNLPLGNNPNANSGGTTLVTNNGVLSGTGTLTTAATLTLSGSNTSMLAGFSGLAANILTIGPSSAQSYNVSTDFSSYTTLTTNGAFTINAPTNGFSTTFTAPSATMTVGGNFTVGNGATFNHSNGTISLGTASQTLNAAVTFYNLTKSISSAATLTFTANKTVTIAGTLSLQGTMTFQDQGSGAILTLKSSAVGTQWSINPTNQSYSGISLTDSNNLSSSRVTCNNCIDGGNNTNWRFGSLSVSFSLTSPANSSRITSSLPSYRWKKADLANRDIYANELGTGTDNSFPAAVRLNNGDLLVAFRAASSHVSTDGKIMLSRSTDNGATWTTKVIYDDPSIDDRMNLGFTVLSDGTLLLPYNKYDGVSVFDVYMLRSTDNGSTWSSYAVPDPAPLLDGIPYGTIIEQPDGTLYMPGYNNTQSYILQSTDRGLTWLFKSYVTDGSGPVNFNETSILRQSATDYIAIGRISGSKIYQSNSTDGGMTWSTPTLLFDGVSPNIIALQNSDLLLCVGDRLGVQGTRCHISSDQGVSWSGGDLILNKYTGGSAGSNGNNGYPAAVQLPDGKIFIAYYYPIDTDNINIGSAVFEVINHQIVLGLNPYYSKIMKYELYLQQSDGTNALHIDNIAASVYTRSASFSGYTLQDDGYYLTLTPSNYSLNLGENSWRVIAYDNQGNTSEQQATFSVVAVPPITETTTATTSSSCSDQTPGSKTPKLSKAVVLSSSTIRLSLTEGDGPLDHYGLQYRKRSGSYPTDTIDIGGKGIKNYTVKRLSSNTKYYFRVRAENGCARGNWSNEISATTLGTVLSATSSTSDEQSEATSAEALATPTTVWNGSPVTPGKQPVKVGVVAKQVVEGAKSILFVGIIAAIAAAIWWVLGKKKKPA